MKLTGESLNAATSTQDSLYSDEVHGSVSTNLTNRSQDDRSTTDCPKKKTTSRTSRKTEKTPKKINDSKIKANSRPVKKKASTASSVDSDTQKKTKTHKKKTTGKKVASCRKNQQGNFGKNSRAKKSCPAPQAVDFVETGLQNSVEPAAPVAPFPVEPPVSSSEPLPPLPETNTPSMLLLTADSPSCQDVSFGNSSSATLKRAKPPQSKSSSGKKTQKVKKQRKSKKFCKKKSYDFENEIDLELDENTFLDDELSSLEEFDELLNESKKDLEPDIELIKPQSSKKTGKKVKSWSEAFDNESEEEDEFLPQDLVPKSPREKVQRRRQIDPTTCERDYTADEVEFMNALDEYKRTSGRMFPTCSEILEVLVGLGYAKTPPQIDEEPKDDFDDEPSHSPTFPTFSLSVDTSKVSVSITDIPVTDTSSDIAASISTVSEEVLSISNNAAYQEEHSVISVSSPAPTVENVFLAEPLKIFPVSPSSIDAAQEMPDTHSEIPMFLLEDFRPSALPDLSQYSDSQEGTFSLNMNENDFFENRSLQKISFFDQQRLAR